MGHINRGDREHDPARDHRDDADSLRVNRSRLDPEGMYGRMHELVDLA